jgi:hypothetical protein
MEAMNRMLRDYSDDFIVEFLDDILIYSKSEEEYERHLNLVLDAPWKNQFYTKMKMYQSLGFSGCFTLHQFWAQTFSLCTIF